jgi:hypothetical protein
MFLFNGNNTKTFTFNYGKSDRFVRMVTMGNFNMVTIYEVDENGMKIDLDSNFALTANFGQGQQLPKNGVLLMNASVPCSLFYRDRCLVRFMPLIGVTYETECSNEVVE